MLRIYITRSLTANSPFLQALSEYDFDIQGHSLIRFEALPFGVIPETDWIFFYSRKAVAFFFQGVKEGKLYLSSRIRWGAIGRASADALAEWGISADFTGTGEPDSTAQNFLTVAKGQRVLFPRAEQSRRSIEKSLAGAIEAIELIVYSNTIDDGAPRPQADIIIFTSPLNAEAYYKCRQPGVQTKIIAIGATTAATLKKLGAQKITIADEPAEDALAQAVLKVL